MPLRAALRLLKTRPRLTIITVAALIWAAIEFFPRPPRLQPHQFIRLFWSGGEFNPMTVCPSHGYLMGGDYRTYIVRILDANSGRMIGILGTEGEKGRDDRHFASPAGIACDEEHGRILVSDPGNRLILVFDINTFKLIQSVETDEPLGGLVLNPRHGRVFATSQTFLPRKGGYVRVLDYETFDLVDNPFPFFHLLDADHGPGPVGVTVDEENGHLLVSDVGKSRVQIFDLATLTYKHTIGTSGEYGDDNRHFSGPTSPKIDAQAGHILVGDFVNHRIQIFDARTFAYVDTLDGAGIFSPQSVAVFDGQVFVHSADRKTAATRINLFGPYVAPADRRP
jgi:DNA-binding beta-propeller fold protein YncE